MTKPALTGPEMDQLVQDLVEEQSIQQDLNPQSIQEFAMDILGSLDEIRHGQRPTLKYYESPRTDQEVMHNAFIDLFGTLVIPRLGSLNRVADIELIPAKGPVSVQLLPDEDQVD